MRWIDAPIWVKTGRFIKWARVFRNYTQGELAMKSGIELKLLRKIEKGAYRDITIEQAYRVALTLGCEVEEIIPLLTPRHMHKKYVLA
ncbi:hypothetical protein A3C59_03985 [Candidatus Daviesbacteria bacterium RIFCSPHIGHO2_02_FULL_36_13]|uniref:HTH cro/C1-type domain-containing protein n=1 Tax=Candidatus Daviesbacteria bacterium RIFCSPHIGHO2_02_FULL_36_13 TaxID=1797768 RepID=A0A1F5JR81_9BACT|nr:MAG: hypothetical protein A3C59_03985 [Candidatus Daviesbacteria bacterium RIFCSPHIGHO2_02_FULL_36_13]